MWHSIYVLSNQPANGSFSPKVQITDYCLTSRAPESCSLQYSLAILIVVVVANMIKLLAMIGTLHVIKAQHFITIGDIVASFLAIPDQHTRGICLATKDTFQPQKLYWLPATSNNARPDVFQCKTKI